MFKYKDIIWDRLKTLDKRCWMAGLAAGVAVMGLAAYCANQISITDEALNKKRNHF